MESLESTAPKDQDLVFDNFVKVLAEHNDVRMFDQIAEEFHKLELAKKGVKQVEISSAMPLSRQAEAEIVDKLNDLVKGKVEVSKKIDESLIGGVVVRLDDQVLDASVKNNLENLRKELSS